MHLACEQDTRRLYKFLVFLIIVLFLNLTIFRSEIENYLIAGEKVNYLTEDTITKSGQYKAEWKYRCTKSASNLFKGETLEF